MEVWKSIQNYEGLYEVSNLGNVKSLPKEQRCANGYRITKEKILKKSVDGRGYFNVVFYKNGIPKTITVHKLVAITFLNHKTDGTLKLVIDHINANRLDNRIENLQIISQRENASKDRVGSSKYTGVCWNKVAKKWMSQIKINGKLKYLGLFKCELAAHITYINKLKEML
jgi:hypothetical protein